MFPRGILYTYNYIICMFGLTSVKGVTVSLHIFQNVLESLHSMKFSVPMSVCSRYPSLLYMKVLPIAIDSSAPKRLAVAILSALKANGRYKRELI